MYDGGCVALQHLHCNTPVAVVVQSALHFQTQKKVCDGFDWLALSYTIRLRPAQTRQMSRQIQLVWLMCKLRLPRQRLQTA